MLCKQENIVFRGLKLFWLNLFIIVSLLIFPSDIPSVILFVRIGLLSCFHKFIMKEKLKFYVLGVVSYFYMEK